MNHEPMHVIILALLLKSGAHLGLMLAAIWLLRKRSAATQSLLLRAALVGLLALGAGRRGGSRLAAQSQPGGCASGEYTC